MKSFQIKEDGTIYKVAESADDLNIVRLNILRNMIAEKSSGMETNDMIEWMKRRRQYYNEHDWSSLFADELNMLQRLQASEAKVFHDSAQLIYALMTLEPNENAFEWDETAAQEKLMRMAREGLTQGEVWNEVEGFILASPKLWESFFLMSLVTHKRAMKSLEGLQVSTERAAPSSQLENG